MSAPKLLSEFVSTSALAEVPSQRFVQPLLMLAGLLDDSTEVVEALAARNSILAAAAISSANRVDGSLLAKLEQSWLDLLKHDELRYSIVACSCFVHASMTSRQVIRGLVAMALTPDFHKSWAGELALEKLNAPDAIVSELVELVLSLPDDEYEMRNHRFGRVWEKLQTAPVVHMLFEQWRASPPDSSTRHRVEGLLATVDKSLLNEELQRIRTGASDPAIAADAERALAERASWKRVVGIPTHTELVERLDRMQRQYEDRVAETMTSMRSMDDRELTAGLRSTDPTVRTAAAKLAAERQVPVGDVILESL